MINMFKCENRWKRIKNSDSDALSFIQKHELYYTGASAHFLKGCDHVWSLNDEEGNIVALLLQSKCILFPVFNGKTHIPSPDFMKCFFKKISLHAAQGIKREVEALENSLYTFGIIPDESIDYELMVLDKPPNPDRLRSGPRDLILRRPNPADMDELFHLQAAYEKEEVLRAKTVFNPAVCRLVLKRIITNELILIAESEGCILGKINTNAASFSRYQIGGVYVKPEYRGLGIASRLTAAFVEDMIACGKGVSLFVKKQNLPARSMYQRVGFTVLDDYRITYY